MAYERLLDREQTPDEELIRKALGREVFPVWEDSIRFLGEHFPDYESETVYYNIQHGWALRYRKEAQQLVMLFPERGAFTALIILNSEENERVMARINYFNTRIRALLSEPSTLPQGRWLWVRIEDHTDFVGLTWLLEQKDLI